MAVEKNTNAERRQLLKKQFITQGAEGMSDETFLEMMLFFSIPYGDTGPLAHRLIERFGSFDRVFDASKEELMAVDGVSEHTATYIMQFKEWMTRYKFAKATTDFTFEDHEAITEFLDANFYGLDHEKALLLHYDESGKFVNSTWVGEGDLENVHLNARKVAASINENETKYVTFVHNHPSGSEQPSLSDLESLLALSNLLKVLNVMTIDNIIYTEKKTLFFTENDNYSDILLRCSYDV